MVLWADKTLYDRIIDRWKEKDTDYGKVNANRDIITTYFRSDEIIDTDKKGNLVGQNIYNGSGPWFSRMMATGFQGSLVSKNIDWFRYRMKQLELKGVDELDIWVQDIKEHMSSKYQDSNFYDVQPQFTHDGLTTGSPVMFGEEDILEQRTMWMPQHYKTVRLYYDKYNQVEGCIVQDKTWTTKQLMDRFAKNDDKQGTKRKAKLNITVNQAIEGGRLDEVFTVYKACFKAADPMFNGGFKKPANKSHKWFSTYFLELTDKDKQNKPLNDNVGDFSQPFAVWNFDKKPWEASSRTPSFYALWDCLSLQQMDKNYLENMQIKNRPATMALNSMKDRLQLGPEGEMFVTKAEYESPPKFLDRVGDIKLDREMANLWTEALKRWFYIDMFQMFSELAMLKKQPVTATQIWQMAGEKSTLLSPAIETHSSYLKVTDDRMMDVEIQAGRGPFDDATMANITDIVMSNIKESASSIDVQPVFIGQLAQAQKVSQALTPIQSTMDTMQPMFDRNPQLLMKYRWYKLAGKVEDALDFPQDVVIPEEEYDELIAADNEAKAQERQQLMAIEMAKASKDISGPVDENSVLAAAAAGATGATGATGAGGGE